MQLSPSFCLLQVGVPTATLVHYVCHIYHSAVIMSVAELLERNNHRGRVDVRLLASWEQVREIYSTFSWKIKNKPCEAIIMSSLFAL